MQTERTKAIAADKAGMDEKTARKYIRLGKLPSEITGVARWRTREDPFKDEWEEIRRMLSVSPGLEAKTLFEEFQRRFPGKFADGQVRTLQRRVKRWRAVEGPAREVFFPQEHKPGVLCESDFTHMDELGITIAGERFDHLIYHLVLTYSDWETGNVCFSESFESLSEGLQKALWELGGVPRAHRTDRLTAAVHKMTHPEEFTARYRALMRHYGLEAERTNGESPHENGDVEQRHHRLKRSVEQSLLLRGSRDFGSRLEYDEFLGTLFRRMNSGRVKRLQEELPLLRRLPVKALESFKRERVKVGPSSTIRVNHNTYSVHSRLIGETVDVRLHAERLEVYYGGGHIESIPRLRGEGGYRIAYRHIIEWLVRKPGAFENYRYREDLFPTHRFRVAYDQIKKASEGILGNKRYLEVLLLAAREGEAVVDRALDQVLKSGEKITTQLVREQLARTSQTTVAVPDVVVPPADLGVYDSLLSKVEEAA